MLALQAGLKLVGLIGHPLGVDAQDRLFDGLPATVVEHHSEDGQAIALGRGIDRAGGGKMKATIANNLHHPALRPGQFDAQRHAAAVTQTAASARNHAQRFGARNLVEHCKGVANGFVDDHVVRRDGRPDGSTQIGGRDGPHLTRAERGLLQGCHTRLLGGTHLSHAGGDALVKGRIGLVAHDGGDLPQHGGTVGLHAQVGGEAPHGEIFFNRVHIHVAPAGMGLGTGVFGQPRYIDIEQPTHVGMGQTDRRVKPRKAGRFARHAQVAGAEFEDPNATQLGQVLQGMHGLCLAPQVGGDHHRVLGVQQLLGQGMRTGGLHATRKHSAIARLGVRPHGIGGPSFGQYLTRQGQEHGARRVTLHHGVPSAQDLFGDHARGQVVFPLHIRTHQTADVERVLHKVHIVVA